MEDYPKFRCEFCGEKFQLHFDIQKNYHTKFRWVRCPRCHRPPQVRLENEDWHALPKIPKARAGHPFYGLNKPKTAQEKKGG